MAGNLSWEPQLLRGTTVLFVPIPSNA
jgi:hypothetical protein